MTHATMQRYLLSLAEQVDTLVYVAEVRDAITKDVVKV